MPSREILAYVIEVGTRAALRTEPLPRDMRWWHGLDFEGRRKRWS